MRSVPTVTARRATRPAPGTSEAGRSPVELARDALAVYRFARLVTRDELTRPWRDRVLLPAIDRPGWQGRAAYGLTCPWCLAVWASGLLALVHRLAPQVGTTLAEVGAVAQLAGMLADRDAG